MAEGYEPVTSEIQTDRRKAYTDLILSDCNDINSIQTSLDQAQLFDYSSNLKYLTNSKVIPISLLNNQNIVSTTNQSMSYFITLFVTQNLKISKMTLEQLRGRLDIVKIDNPLNLTNVTESEQILYSVLENGLNSMRYFNSKIAQTYCDSMVEFADMIIQQLTITIAVSICTIVGVFIIITPLISRIQDKKYDQLLLFLKVPVPMMKEMIENS